MAQIALAWVLRNREVVVTNAFAYVVSSRQMRSARTYRNRPSVVNSDNGSSRAYPAGGRRKLPQAPGNPRRQGLKTLLIQEIPAHSRRAQNGHDRPMAGAIWPPGQLRNLRGSAYVPRAVASTQGEPPAAGVSSSSVRRGRVTFPVPQGGSAGLAAHRRRDRVSQVPRRVSIGDQPAAPHVTRPAPAADPRAPRA